MMLPNVEIKRMIFATLFSLAIYGIVAQIIDWGSEKSPWDTRKVKFTVLIVVAIISLYFLFCHFRDLSAAKKIKHERKYRNKSMSSPVKVSA